MNIELNGFLGGLALTLITVIGIGGYYAWRGGRWLWHRATGGGPGEQVPS